CEDGRIRYYQRTGETDDRADSTSIVLIVWNILGWLILALSRPGLVHNIDMGRSEGLEVDVAK
ncbi:MAG TPA: hypothetical protein VMH84_10465, partial [Xanthobacteraceae bacterium]|nr:hypothetical protein [Xanthobacteraceae bacterium]